MPTTIDLTHAPISAAAIAADDHSGNCPTCQMSGVTPERALREEPRYMQALLAMDTSQLDPYTPDEPRACCWDCRRMIALGVDPAALLGPGLADGLAGMAPGDRAVAEQIADLGEIEPAPGYAERAVERARREGVLR